MRRSVTGLLLLLVAASCVGGDAPPTSTLPATPSSTPLESLPEASSVVVALPQVRTRGEVSLEETLLQRRSVREYADAPLTMQEVSQLLWAAQGITAEWGGRTAPSAGALYPLEVYLVVGRVEGLAPGVYKYRPAKHELSGVKDGDVRGELAEAAVGQSCVRDGAVDIVIGAVYQRTTGKYDERGITYVHIEVGHAAQNVCLQATALGLGAVTVGAFYDDRVKEIAGMEDEEVPLYIIPVGRRE